MSRRVLRDLGAKTIVDIFIVPTTCQALFLGDANCRGISIRLRRSQGGKRKDWSFCFKSGVINSTLQRGQGSDSKCPYDSATKSGL